LRLCRRQLPAHPPGADARGAGRAGALPEAPQPREPRGGPVNKASSEASLLEVKDLKRHYRIGGGVLRKPRSLRAVDGVSFSLAAGGPRGGEGEPAGEKRPPAHRGRRMERPTEGTLKRAGPGVTTAGPAEMKRLRPVVQMVFQNPYGSLNPRKKVGTILE